MDILGEPWHLAQNEIAMKVTEFGMQLWRVFFSFSHYQEECEKYVNGISLNVDELAILHVIRMRDIHKTITDIGRFLNRNDNHNIRYSVGKLLKLGFIVKEEATQNKKNLLFQITEAGIQSTNNYTKIQEKYFN